MPVWRYEVEDVVIEKSLVLLHGQNTVHVHYRLISSQEKLCLELSPAMHFRGHERPVSEAIQREYVFSAEGQHYEVYAGDAFPRLRLMLKGENTTFTHHGGMQREISYQNDADRGYESRGVLWSPGNFSVGSLPSRARR